MRTPPKDEAAGHGAGRITYSEVIEVGGIQIPYDPRIISAGLRERMRLNRYESGEALKATLAVRDGDRVIELGAGVGYLS
ncbi:MAG TPA: hypothetical protein EYP40_04980, partial [Chromatiales bacterium]|nr:hypothetical protein [Chromatiales bacterium]